MVQQEVLQEAIPISFPGMETELSNPSKNFTKQIAFNVIPHIDSFMEDGYTKEEWKMTAETKKILDSKYMF